MTTRTDCLNCLKPMKVREGKKFCTPECRIAYWRNPKSAGKLRAQIERIFDEVLPPKMAAYLKSRGIA